MEQNRFFRAIWRFNALLFALGGLFILGYAGWNMLLGPRLEPTPEGHYAPVPKDAEVDSTYRLESTGVSVAGESILSLQKWKGAPRTYGLAMELRVASSYGSVLNGVNLLAINDSTSTGHWLFHGFKRSVISEQGMMTGENMTPVPGVIPNTVALVIQTIDSDTNNDGELTEKDKQSLYVYRPGMRLAEKFLDADFVISREQTGADTFLVVYERGKVAIAATFSVPDFKLKSESPIPSVPN